MAALGDARDGTLSDPTEIVMRLHVNRGSAPAQQIERVSVGSDGGNLHLHRRVDEVPEHGDVCGASDSAPHVPIAGTSAVSMISGDLHIDRLFCDDMVSLRVMDVSSKYSLFTPVRPTNP